jgi:L-2-hydroxyglutarate oxidase LhgO
MSNQRLYDFAILGGGLYGMKLTQMIKNKFPSSKILMIEKRKRHEVANQTKNFIPLETGYNYPFNSKKFNFVRRGSVELEKLCKENNLEIYAAEHLILAKHKLEKERMEFFMKHIENNELKEAFSLSKIPFEKAREIEPLLEHKKLEKVDIYHLGLVTLVDEMAIKNLIYKNLIKFASENKNSIEILFNTHVKELKQGSNEIEIKSIGLKEKNPLNHIANYVIDSSGYSALDFAHQLGLMKEYKSTKILFNYYVDKLSENAKFPNAILSLPAFKLNPGISVYIDNEDNCKLGPIYKMKDELLGNSSILSSFRNVYEWTKLYSILHSAEKDGYDPDIEYMYNQKVKVINMFKELCTFESHKLNSQTAYEIKQISSIVYCNKIKKIEEDFMFAESKNSMHLVNFNIFGKFSSFIPACEHVCNLIK